MAEGRLAGKAAVVFGGGLNTGPGGVVSIGAASATTFARHGARVAVVDRDPEAAQRTVAAIGEDSGGAAVALVADVTDPGQVQRAVAQAVAHLGRIDVVQNTVGAARLGGLDELTLTDWHRTLALNLDTVFLAAQATMPHLLERGGSMVNVSSTASIRWTGYPYPGYAAAKAGVNQLTRSLALQYAARGVRVNAVLAGLIDTPLVYAQLGGEADDDQVRAERDVLSPTGRAGTAQDVADAALFLASDESRYVTGVLLPVDGGLAARAV
ncbi:NAD(P)-dependent dehydrogenase, short-chain alcohol dehydrogenase family [Klenkia marina]|uniref:NAD(P)-dependent dehydrogenase, short-chain alcohol dehydrogenase family n=1 Tax=Klenkia marina TaxID=1960309 RepID=A0A1G4YPJ4_9ACTN|nr:SDR family NAD(P)-dependent oxidoreductase [Klenkia marina]SCX55319.1 NAD(P)-dependent dehydrogenase, short-chain alcohol dehydrogenase family [Klenkia marina]